MEGWLGYLARRIAPSNAAEDFNVDGEALDAARSAVEEHIKTLTVSRHIKKAVRMQDELTLTGERHFGRAQQLLEDGKNFKYYHFLESFKFSRDELEFPNSPREDNVLKVVPSLKEFVVSLPPSERDRLTSQLQAGERAFVLSVRRDGDGRLSRRLHCCFGPTEAGSASISLSQSYLSLPVASAAQTAYEKAYTGSTENSDGYLELPKTELVAPFPSNKAIVMIYKVLYDWILNNTTLDENAQRRVLEEEIRILRREDQAQWRVESSEMSSDNSLTRRRYHLSSSPQWAKGPLGDLTERLDQGQMTELATAINAGRDVFETRLALGLTNSYRRLLLLRKDIFSDPPSESLEYQLLFTLELQESMGDATLHITGPE